MGRQKIYIAGKVSGEDRRKVFLKFMVTEKYLSAKGSDVENPREILRIGMTMAAMYAPLHHPTDGVRRNIPSQRLADEPRRAA